MNTIGLDLHQRESHVFPVGPGVHRLATSWPSLRQAVTMVKGRLDPTERLGSLPCRRARTGEAWRARTEAAIAVPVSEPAAELRWAPLGT